MRRAAMRAIEDTTFDGFKPSYFVSFLETAITFTHLFTISTGSPNFLPFALGFLEIAGLVKPSQTPSKLLRRRSKLTSALTVIIG
jgi:hypothetical protein